MNDPNTSKTDKDANPDPITGAPGAHPVGTGIGAAGAGAAGTAIGAAVGGPVGAVVGAVVGSVAGGLAGKGIAEKIDPTQEDAHWRESYAKEPYYERDYSYDDYAPAYRTGYSNYTPGRKFEDSERDLEQHYNANRGSSRLTWDKAKRASRAAWDRVERTIPGDADRDGK